MPFDLYKDVILRFIRYYFLRAKAKKAILGVSGGIDSSLALKLTVEALGEDKVFALIMPFEGITPGSDVDDAVGFVDDLGVEYKIVPINEIVEDFVGVDEDLNNNYVKGNIIARTRMILLYAYANLHRGLVVGTSDKSELLLGYFTKYGDGGSDIMPIGDLYKTQVRKMASKLGLPEKIVRKPSSPALWPGQSAEEEIGASYEDVDVVLYLVFEKGLHPNNLSAVEGLDPKIVSRVLELVFRNEHKRKFPRIPKLQNGGTVGLDWKYPVWMGF